MCKDKWNYCKRKTFKLLVLILIIQIIVDYFYNLLKKINLGRRLVHFALTPNSVQVHS